MRNPELEKATRKLGSKQAIGERIIGTYHSCRMSHAKHALRDILVKSVTNVIPCYSLVLVAVSKILVANRFKLMPLFSGCQKRDYFSILHLQNLQLRLLVCH